MWFGIINNFEKFYDRNKKQVNWKGVFQGIDDFFFLVERMDL